MSDDEYQKNVLGEKLEACSADPLTGWLRDGCCNTNETDHGVHTVCTRVTTKFLEWAKIAGNDLITPHPECKVYLKKTNQKTLEIIPLEKLKKYAIDLS